MTKRPEARKKTVDDAPIPKIEGITPEQDGFRSESPEVSESIEKTRQYHI